MYVSLWKRAALFVACFGMIVPQGALVAAEPASQHQTARMLDVALTSGGTLSGQVVDAQGKLIEGAVVAVRFQNRVVAKTTTDAEGRYAVRGLRGGIHQIETTQGRVAARFWTPETAPPAARPSALIVSDTNVIRAQCGEGCGSGDGRIVHRHGGWVQGHSYRQGGSCLQQNNDPCCNPGPTVDHGMLVTGLVIAGVVTAIAIAADDDDDNNRPASP